MDEDALLKVRLSAPEQAVVELEAREITLPGAAGVFHVLPGHTPLLSTLLTGVMVIHDAQRQPHYYSLSTGFAEVRGNTVNVLAESFEVGREIDTERAQQALERAHAALKMPGTTSREIAMAERAIAKAMARLHAYRGEPLH